MRVLAKALMQGLLHNVQQPEICLTGAVSTSILTPYAAKTAFAGKSGKYCVNFLRNLQIKGGDIASFYLGLFLFPAFESPTASVRVLNWLRDVDQDGILTDDGDVLPADDDVLFLAQKPKEF